MINNTEHSPGLAGARNSGLDLARGEFIATCDDDDTWLPGKLRLQVGAAARRTRPAGRGRTGSGCCCPTTRCSEWPGRSDRISYDLLLRNRVKELHSSTLVMRREAFAKAGQYDEQLPNGYAEDYDWVLRVARVGNVGVVRQPLANIRKNAPSWYRNVAETACPGLEHMLAKHTGLHHVAPRACADAGPDRLRQVSARPARTGCAVRGQGAGEVAGVAVPLYRAGAHRDRRHRLSACSVWPGCCDAVWRRRVLMSQRLPNFLHIGPGKTGSTWLHEVLIHHPEFYFSEAKDLYFFSRYYDRGLDWYGTQFRDARPEHKIIGEVITRLPDPSGGRRADRDLPRPGYPAHGHAARARLAGLLRLPASAQARPCRADVHPDRAGRRRACSTTGVTRPTCAGTWTLRPQVAALGIFDDLRADPQAFLDDVTEWLGVGRQIVCPELLKARLPASSARWLPLATTLKQRRGLGPRPRSRRPGRADQALRLWCSGRCTSRSATTGPVMSPKTSRSSASSSTVRSRV